jgi:hypothetical protein
MGTVNYLYRRAIKLINKKKKQKSIFFSFFFYTTVYRYITVPVQYMVYRILLYGIIYRNTVYNILYTQKK